MSEADVQMNSFYAQVQEVGKLRSLTHADRWSAAVLRTLGLSLDRKTKKRLAKALPTELAFALERAYWLIHFRNSGMSIDEFLGQVSRRSGNSDADFARYPTSAVFGALKSLIDPELSESVTQALSPEVRLMWQQA